MMHDDRLQIPIARERRSREIARGILALGLIAAVLVGAWALLTKKKARIFGPVISFVIVPLIAILVASFIMTLLKRGFDTLQREDAE